MRLSNIKDGDIVVINKGEAFIKIGSAFCSCDGYELLDRYNEDLIHKQLETWDIVKIYRPHFESSLDLYFRFLNGNTGNLNLIYIKEEINWMEVEIDTPIKIANKQGDYLVRHFASYNKKTDVVKVYCDGKTSFTTTATSIAKELVCDYSHMEIIKK